MIITEHCLCSLLWLYTQPTNSQYNIPRVIRLLVYYILGGLYSRPDGKLVNEKSME